MACHRRKPRQKTLRLTHCSIHANGSRDPARHSAHSLATFMRPYTHLTQHIIAQYDALTDAANTTNTTSDTATATHGAHFAAATIVTRPKLPP